MNVGLGPYNDHKSKNYEEKIISWQDISNDNITVGWGEYGTAGGEDGTPLSVECMGHRSEISLYLRSTSKFK